MDQIVISIGGIEIFPINAVLQRLRSMSDITCILVTHRPATEEFCDWKLEMDEGKIYLHLCQG